MQGVSVVVPMFNSSSTIVEALESIFASGFSPLEAVVVDDGSSDGSVERVRQYRDAHRNHAVSLISHPDGLNLGASASRNLGVDHAAGKYVAFLDADDLYRPNRFATSVRLLEERPDLSAVFGTFLYEIAGRADEKQVRDITSDLVTAVEQQTLISPDKEDFLSQLLRGKVGLHTSTITIRREAFVKAGGFPHFRYGEDHALWLRIFSTCAVARIDDAPVSVYRIHQDSLCSRGERSPEFIFGPVHSLIDAAQWLKHKPEAKAALNRILVTLPGKLFHQFPKIQHSTPDAKRYMRAIMWKAACVCPRLLLDRRFYSVLLRLLFG
jgi:glycosyltransferase involved in cell wall biosynthesis